MSEWTGTVRATVLDLEADFDIVLCMLWHLQWKPLYDRETLALLSIPQRVHRGLDTNSDEIKTIRLNNFRLNERISELLKYLKNI